MPGINTHKNVPIPAAAIPAAKATFYRIYYIMHWCWYCVIRNCGVTVLLNHCVTLPHMSIICQYIALCRVRQEDGALVFAKTQIQRFCNASALKMQARHEIESQRPALYFL